MSHSAHIQGVFDLLSAPGSPFECGDVDVRGQTYTGYVNAPAHVRHLWLGCKAQDTDEYLVYEDERITYGQARARVLQVANALIDDFGVQPGDSVGLALRNYPEWVLGWWAIQMAGAVAVEINSFWNETELAYGITDSGSGVVIADQARHEALVAQQDTIAAAGIELRTIVVRSSVDLGAGATHWDDVTGDEAVPELAIGTDDRAAMVYTSGTTAFPKGVVHSQRNIVTNHFNMVFLNLGMRLAEVSAEGGDPKAAAAAADASPQSVMLVAVPLFHVTGSHCVMLPITATGGKLVLMYKWNAERALELIEREKVTNFTGVPTMTMDMLASPAFASTDTSTLSGMSSGGAPNPPHMVAKVDGAIKNASVAQGYGLSEVSGIATANGGIFYGARAGSCGVAPRIAEMKVVDNEGQTLSNGEAGELCIRGPHVFVEYHNKPEATAAVVDAAGWFHTGDIATIDDDSFVTIVDRAKDVVIRGGENVGCAEVEAAVARHPDVHECAVFGLPDERLGETVAVAIHPLAGMELDPEQVREFAAGSLAAFKVPSSVFIYDTPLPKNPNGKILKRQLREELGNSGETQARAGSDSLR